MNKTNDAVLVRRLIVPNAKEGRISGSLFNLIRQENSEIDFLWKDVDRT